LRPLLKLQMLPTHCKWLVRPHALLGGLG